MLENIMRKNKKVAIGATAALLGLAGAAALGKHQYDLNQAHMENMADDARYDSTNGAQDAANSRLRIERALRRSSHGDLASRNQNILTRHQQQLADLGQTRSNSIQSSNALQRSLEKQTFDAAAQRGRSDLSGFWNPSRRTVTTPKMTGLRLKGGKLSRGKKAAIGTTAALMALAGAAGAAAYSRQQPALNIDRAITGEPYQSRQTSLPSSTGPSLYQTASDSAYRYELNRGAQIAARPVVASPPDTLYLPSELRVRPSSRLTAFAR